MPRMQRRSWIAVVAVGGLVGCGSSSSPARQGGGSAARPVDAGATARFSRVKRPPVSPACARARSYLGYAATCVEQPLPELSTAAGEVVRLWAAGDPTRAWVYALVPPHGEPAIAVSGPYHDGILAVVTSRLDVPATPPDVLARLYAELGAEAAVVRCLPGDALPAGRTLDRHPCVPPRLVTRAGATVLEFALEEFPHPALLNRDRHLVYWEQVAVEPHGLSMREGTGLVELDATTPLPPSAPPLPAMSQPPTELAAPVAAPADVSAALCQAAADRLAGLAGRACRAYAYPSLTLPTAEFYYLANDAGQGHLIATRAPDGTVWVGLEVDQHSPFAPLVAAWDPAKVSAATFLAAYLLVDGTRARVRCLPGSGDALPDDPCPAPTARKDGADLTIEAVLEELPAVGAHDRGHDPAVRRIAWQFTPGGGMSGGGTRLIDLREDAE